MDELFHYGTPRHSGRYPWGSGENPYQHEEYFANTVKEFRSVKPPMTNKDIANALGMTMDEFNSNLVGEIAYQKEQGKTDTEIAHDLGMTTGLLRALNSSVVSEQKSKNIAMAIKLKQEHPDWSNAQIGEEMGGYGESTVRSWLKATEDSAKDANTATAEMLKEQIADKQFIDIGEGTELYLNGVSETRLKNAAALLKEEEGYKIYYVDVEQATNPGKFTTIKVLAGPDTTYADVANNKDKIQTITSYTRDNGSTWQDVIFEPSSLDSSRVMVRYAEDGGKAKDGTIEIRRGVEDLNIGDSNYAQVRIAVDGTHYLKGMAIYSDGKDMPEGVDVIFNTNKTKDVPMLGSKDSTVLKNLKSDPTNPFGATIKVGGQSFYSDSDGIYIKKGESYILDDGSYKDADHYSLNKVNKVNDEGDWQKWSKTLPSQFLSKQNMPLVKQQLNLAYSEKFDEYSDICALTNPTVKRKLLQSFADDCDSSAVHLKAAALPRQAAQVILPLTSIKDDEVYAPNYKNGETVVLIRFPHGGRFEIPQLTVNNKNSEGRDILGNAKDAIGISSKVAQKLSGADFDGDTVLVIPANNGTNSPKVNISKSLEGLEDFDPSERYPKYEGMTILSKQRTQTEMGIVSNLITDMTIKGATPDELARAVRHSMVIIDANKHELNYKQSYIDNNIAELKEKYQGKTSGGASTLLSRAKNEVRVNQRKQGYNIDPKTGIKLYSETGNTTKSGKLIQQVTTRMADTEDAMTLLSDQRTPVEMAYATYANKLKSLGNDARKELVSTGKLLYSPAAKTKYATEVESLNSKLNIALMNAPRERQAQLAANVVISAKKKDNPDMTKGDIKKLSSQVLGVERARVCAKKDKVNITDTEWEAIQAGAISDSTLSKILDNCDLDQVKQYATPKTTTTVSNAKIARIHSMMNTGYTTSEIAEALGLSTSTVSKYMS